MAYRFGFPTSLLVAGLVATPSLSSAAEPVPSQEPSTDVSDTRMALGGSHSEAQRRAYLQGVAQDIRPVARVADPGYYGLWIEGEIDGLVYSTINVDQGTRIITNLVPADVPVVVRASNLSEEGLELGIANWQDHLALGGVSGVHLWGDKARGSVIADVDESMSRRVKAAMDSMPHSVHPDLVLNVVPGGAAPRETATLYGGTIASNCTWGFKVLDSGVPRMMTAGHCGNTQYYSTTRLPFLDDVNSGNADAQIHSIPSGNTADNAILLNGETVRQIYGRVTWANMDVGDAVCQQGKSSGQSCGVITSVTASQAAGGGTRVIRVEGDYLRGEGGDSGGPVYYGNNAWGIVEGGSGTRPNRVLLFTAINYNESALGVIVDTA